LIVTIPRYGFRFDADVIFQPAQNIDTSAPEPQLLSDVVVASSFQLFEAGVRVRWCQCFAQVEK
jgi:DNA-binding winged helix-turn-helix (wHTH) protein